MELRLVRRFLHSQRIERYVNATNWLREGKEFSIIT
jgi:hypothetical protein